jgi:hypothetical protein
MYASLPESRAKADGDWSEFCANIEVEKQNFGKS